MSEHGQSELGDTGPMAPEEIDAVLASIRAGGFAMIDLPD